MPGDWEQHGRCKRVSPGVMYPEADTGQQQRARAVCALCPVREECLRHALEVNERWGTWGGLGEAPRDRLRKYLKSHMGASLMEAVRATGTDWSPPAQEARAS